jgi:hypothetical protein
LPLAVGPLALPLRPWRSVFAVLVGSSGFIGVLTVDLLSQAVSKHVTRQCAFTANRIIGGHKMRTEIRRLAREMGSVIYQGSRILQIHLFDMCMASLGDAYHYLTTVNLVSLIRQCFRGSAHNWVPTQHQPGTPFLQQRDHVDTVIHNWRAGGDFVATTLPPCANNILTDEVDHWVRTNIVVYSSIRTVLQQAEYLINWEFDKHNAALRKCNHHAVELVKHRQQWMPHVVNGVVCGCSTNNVIPWLVGLVAHVFPLADDDHVVPGEWHQCFAVSACLNLMLNDSHSFGSLSYSFLLQDTKSSVTGPGNGAASHWTNRTLIHAHQRRKQRHGTLPELRISAIK